MYAGIHQGPIITAHAIFSTHYAGPKMKGCPQWHGLVETEEIAIISLVLLFIGINIAKEIRSGELGQIIGFFKMMKEGQADVFDGETRTLAVEFDGVEGTIEVRSLNDFSMQMSNMRKSATIYLEESGKFGRTLDIRMDEIENDDIVKIAECIGGELVREQEFNMDKEGPMGLMSFIGEALKSASPDGEEWWK